MEKERREQEFLASLIYFADVKVCVEIGVAHGSTSLHFCRALTKTGGWLYGYDVWDRHGQKGQFSAFGSKDKVADLLTQKGFVNFSLTQMDTIGNKGEFATRLKEDCPQGIDFAFIDGDHSYRGICNDFSVVYPLMKPKGIVAFHDTLRIDGCREFVLDLRTKFNDGTFDIVDFPWGMGNRDCGVTLLVKRAYPTVGMGIDESCGSPSVPARIEGREREWHKQQVETHKKTLEPLNADVPLVYGKVTEA